MQRVCFLIEVGVRKNTCVTTNGMCSTRILMSIVSQTKQVSCFQDTWAIANDWPHLRKCVDVILSRVAAHHEGYYEVCTMPFCPSLWDLSCPPSLAFRLRTHLLWQVALVTFGSAWPYSTCPLQGTQWTQDVEHARQCLEGLQPSLGGCRVQPLLTGALSQNMASPLPTS